VLESCQNYIKNKKIFFKLNTLTDTYYTRSVWVCEQWHNNLGEGEMKAEKYLKAGKTDLFRKVDFKWG